MTARKSRTATFDPSTSTLAARETASTALPSALPSGPLETSGGKSKARSGILNRQNSSWNSLGMRAKRSARPSGRSSDSNRLRRS